MAPTGRVGEWQLVEQLGRGGMGTVWRARAADGREVALKLLQSGSASARMRFGREARMLTRLSHPHVVSVLGAGVEDDVPYLVLELVEGGRSLQDVLDREGPLPPQRAVRIARQVAEGLAHAHAQGLLHRDLKPANVLLRGDDEALVTDFGLARDLLFPDGLTVSGQQMGTPGYWAPEQARGELQRVGARSDVYGLGATLYALLTGVPPHGVPDSIQAVLDAATQRPPPPSSRREGLDPWLDAVCLRCLALEPEERFAGPAEVGEALASWEAQAPESGPSPRAVGLGLLLLGAAVAGLILLMVPGRRRADAAALVDPVAPASPLPAASPVAPPPVAPPPVAPPPVAPPPGLPAGPVDEVAREEALRHARRGRSLQAEHHYEEALREHAQALALDPRCAEAYIGRSLIHELQGRRQAGLADALQATVVAPQNAEAWAHLSVFHGIMGRPREAVADAERALALDPELACAWARRGEQRLDDDPVGALADLDRALALDPNDALAHSARGQARTVLGQHEGAREDLDLAVAGDPDQALHWGRRGVLRMAEGDLAGARSDLDRAIELDPDSVWLRLQRCMVLSALEEKEAARVDAEKLVELAPRQGRSWFERGRVRASMGEAEPALSDFERAVELEPGNLDYLAARGRLRLAAGQREGGLQDLRTALAGLPDGSPRALEVKSWLEELEDR